MPLERVMLWGVVAAAAVWLAAVALGAVAAGPFGVVALAPLAFLVYALWRAIGERRRNAEDDRYDRIER